MFLGDRCGLGGKFKTAPEQGGRPTPSFALDPSQPSPQTLKRPMPPPNISQPQEVDEDLPDTLFDLETASDRGWV